MSITFNADEALAMACEIERNGAKFYARAAEIAGEGPVRKLLADLVEWEKGHEELFASMRAELTDEEKRSTAHDPDGEAELYLQAMADAHVFKGDDDPAAGLSGKESPAEIIGTAIGKEQESILFYAGLAKMIPARLGNVKVQKIIDEEIGHVAFLKRELKGIEGA
ncbi:MAG: ferritin family protein [Planctomycetota bacterium]|jgi:rubrerythrin